MILTDLEVIADNKFWFSAVCAASGLLIHTMTGAKFGVGFALITRRPSRTPLVPAGAV